jgi:hypothetical protein
LFIEALAGLDRAALLDGCGGRSNPMIWIAGHLTLSRCNLANLVGDAREAPWPHLFARGSKGGDLRQYPEISEILKAWSDLSDSLMSRLGVMSHEELSARVDREIPTTDGTVRGAVAFSAYHEAYHIGQMGYLRSWLGHGGLVG